MLPRSQRLSVEQFNQVMEKGRIIHSPLFLMRVFRDEAIDGARVSAVAPQKIVKTASARNKLRRQMYEAIQSIHSHLDPHVYIVLFAKAAAVKTDFTVLEKETADIFVKGGVMK